MKFLNIIFDLDGTLIDSSEGISKCFKYALSNFGILENDSDKIKQAMGPPLYQSFTQIWGLGDEDAKKAIEIYRNRYKSAGMYENKLYSNITKTLEELQNLGCRLFIATSKAENVAKDMLDHFDISKYFTQICGSNPNKHEETKVDVLNRALEFMGTIEIGSTVMIGDRYFDLDAADVCGINGVGVLYGFGEYKELAACKSDFLAETVSDLRDYLIN